MRTAIETSDQALSVPTKGYLIRPMSSDLRQKTTIFIRTDRTSSTHSIKSTHISLGSRPIPSKRRDPDPNTSPNFSGEFNTAMVHFYRGEVQRSNTWRNRLDTTTNWAVITAGATLSFVFSSTANPHFVIPINSVLVAFFLFMEARRYRYYEIWSSRVRVIETGYFAQLLAPQSAIDKDWAEHLAADLLTPHFTISEWEAVGRRLRRNYLWIFMLLAVSWNLKVYLHPRLRFHSISFWRASIGLCPALPFFSRSRLQSGNLYLRHRDGAPARSDGRGAAAP